MQLIAAKSGNNSQELARFVSPLVEIALISLSPAPPARNKRDLLSLIDPTMADLITPALMKKIHEYETLETFLASVPKDGSDYHQQRIMAMYLSCSGYTQENNVCLDGVFCQYGDAHSDMTDEERDVLSIVLYNIMTNEFVTEEYKTRLRSAARLGRDFGRCSKYDCPALSSSSAEDD